MELKSSLKKFIENNFFIKINDDFGDETSFLDSGIIDSTGVLELITFLEGEFGIKIEDEEIIPQNLDSIQNIISYTSRKIKERL